MCKRSPQAQRSQRVKRSLTGFTGNVGEFHLINRETTGTDGEFSLCTLKTDRAIAELRN
jgi:hypothetical protein